MPNYGGGGGAGVSGDAVAGGSRGVVMLTHDESKIIRPTFPSHRLPEKIGPRPNRIRHIGLYGLPTLGSIFYAILERTVFWTEVVTIASSIFAAIFSVTPAPTLKVPETVEIARPYHAETVVPTSATISSATCTSATGVTICVQGAAGGGGGGQASNSSTAGGGGGGSMVVYGKW